MLPDPSITMQSSILTLEAAVHAGTNNTAKTKVNTNRLSKKSVFALENMFFPIPAAPSLQPFSS
jgi:hypothetical protein